MTEPPRIGHYMARVRRLHGAGPRADPAARHLSRTLRPLITFSGCVLVVACLYLGQAVLIPIALAILITFFLGPVVSALRRVSLPQTPAVLVVVILAVSVAGAVDWLPGIPRLLTSAGLVILLVVFMLVRRQELRPRLIRLCGHGRLTVTTKALDEAGSLITRYLLMQTVLNACFADDLVSSRKVDPQTWRGRSAFDHLLEVLSLPLRREL